MTAFALSLVIKIYENYGSINNDEIAKMGRVKKR
jgi:multisubunit Na+/H+ antiporter MnhC subunit